MTLKVFFPQTALDQWVVDGAADLQQGELSFPSHDRRFKVIEAVHVVAEVTGAPDANELAGRVKPKATLEELGAEIFEGSMILGDLAYDVVPGWVGTPVPGAQPSDEALLRELQAGVAGS